jgi:hypothetical protein
MIECGVWIAECGFWIADFGIQDEQKKSLRSSAQYIRVNLREIMKC